MKSLDNVVIPDRVFYYLLDFNDCDDFKTLKAISKSQKLSSSTYEEIMAIFNLAVTKDLMRIANKEK